MDKIKRFVECLLPVTACNLKCSYCYIVQENRRTNQMPNLKYSPEHIALALSRKRLGGTAFISICGAGETMLPKQLTQIVKLLLEQGHYVNVTTNGTVSKRFDEILSLPKELLAHLHFSFSFHFTELKKHNLIDIFFQNIKKVKESGASFLLQLNLCDEYIPYLDEIKSICKKNVGAYPQLCATRNEKSSGFALMTDMSADEYKKIAASFSSPLFDFTMKNFNVKRHEFCYAGDWSFVLDLETGLARKCYNSLSSQNIFENLSKPIHFEAVGCSCNSRYCVNSSHFMSLGVIPKIETPTYGELRKRKNAEWQTKETEYFLNTKLSQSNMQYGKAKKIYITCKERAITIYFRFRRICGRIIRTIFGGKNE